jgi:hypothetical protein
MKNIAQLKINDFKDLDKKNLKRLQSWVKNDLPRNLKLLDKVNVAKIVKFTLK